MKRVRPYTLTITSTDSPAVVTRIFLSGESAAVEFRDNGVQIRSMMQSRGEDRLLPGEVWEEMPDRPRAFGAALWTCRCTKDNGQLRKHTADVEWCGRCNTFRPLNLSEKIPT